MDLARVYNILKDMGIRPSRQRVLLYYELDNRDDYPTAETLFQDLKPEIPTLSKTTIYNTMKLFVDKNIVQTIQVDGRESRFALNKEGQGFFYCKDCDQIKGVQLGTMPEIADKPEDMEIEDVLVVFRGKCKDCK